MKYHNWNNEDDWFNDDDDDDDDDDNDNINNNNNNNNNNNKKDANSVIGVFQEVLIKLYYITILLYIEGQDDIYWWSVLGLLVLVVEDCY